VATDPFVVHIARLRRSPGTTWHEVRRGPVEMAGPLHEAGVDPGKSVVPTDALAECEIDLQAFSGGIAAVGTVRAPWVGLCRRCTTPVDGELVIAVREQFGSGGTGGTGGEQAEDETYPIADDAIDLGPLVRDAIVLDLPMAPLCRADCLGLCPHCGADRNEGECGCVAPRDPRWANLDVLR